MEVTPAVAFVLVAVTATAALGDKYILVQIDETEEEAPAAAGYKTLSQEALRCETPMGVAVDSEWSGVCPNRAENHECREYHCSCQDGILHIGKCVPKDKGKKPCIHYGVVYKHGQEMRFPCDGCRVLCEDGKPVKRKEE